MTKSEWTRIPDVNGGTCGAKWIHVSGWIVYHCGHPTALWPYYALPPGVDPSNHSHDEMLLHGGMGLGRAFRKVRECQDAVEAKARPQH